MPNCNSCIQLNPIPACASGEEYILTGLKFEPNTAYTARFLNTSTGRLDYINFTTDGSGNAEIDIAELCDLPNHVFEISFMTLAGVEVDFTLTNPDATVETGCCLELTVLQGIGAVEWALNSVLCSI